MVASIVGRIIVWIQFHIDNVNVLVNALKTFLFFKISVMVEKYRLLLRLNKNIFTYRKIYNL